MTPLARVDGCLTVRKQKGKRLKVERHGISVEVESSYRGWTEWEKLGHTLLSLFLCTFSQLLQSVPLIDPSGQKRVSGRFGCPLRERLAQQDAGCHYSVRA